MSVLSCPNPPFGIRPFTNFSSVTVLVFACGEVLGGVIDPIIPDFSLLHLDFFFDSMPAPLSVFLLGFNSSPFSLRFLFLDATFMRVAADGGSLVNLIVFPLLLGSFFVVMGSFIGRVADGFDTSILLVGVLSTLFSFSDCFFASCFNLRVCLVSLMDLTASLVILLALTTVLPVFMLVTILIFR